MVRATGRQLPKGRMPVAKSGKLDREANPWYWHPSRVGVAGPLPSFSSALEAVDKDLAATWNGYTKKWQVWSKAPRIQHPVCWGWKLLFVEDHLGPWTLARLYEASTDRWGSAKAYFDAIKREMERDKESAERTELANTMDSAMETFDHSRIKVGYGPSNGSKFSTYHS